MRPSIRPKNIGTRWGTPSGPIDASCRVRSWSRNSSTSASVIRMRCRWLAMAENPARGAVDFPVPGPPTRRKRGRTESMQAERYPTESALLSGAAGGDPDAVRALIDSVGPVVYGFVFARVGGDEPTAQDLLPKTLIEALLPAPTFRVDAALRTWVCAISRA